MKILLKYGALVTFIVAVMVYGYAYMHNLEKVSYVSKLLITPMLILYYVISVKKINKLFLGGLVLAFFGNIVSFFGNEFSIILSMAFALFFLLIHMVLIANLIGAIKIRLFLKISIVSMVILNGFFYLNFHNDQNQIYILFYVFASVIAIYIVFSVYLFRLRKDNASLLNLIGVFFFLFFSVCKGMEITSGSKGTHSVQVICYYPIFLFLVTSAFIEFHKAKAIAQ